jgi:capsular exopolysaccharide synthesis family protein
VVVAEAPHSSHAESFRQLRTSLQFLDVGARAGGPSEARRLLSVTSSLAGEGKTTVAVNLAVALAETSARVLLVDADLRRPSVATRLGVEGAVGLTTVLVGQAEVSDVVQPWGGTGLDVLTSGELPPNPGELLGSPAMRSLLARLRAEYDFVIVDTAPLLPVADGAIVASLVDGTLLLANVAKVRRYQLAESLGSLARVEASLLGVVLNRVARDVRSYGYAADDGAGTRSPAVGSAAKAGRVANPRPPLPALR